MPCVGCNAQKKIFALGLCQPCYYRLRRNGTVLRKYVVNSGTCSVEGCGKHSFAKNLCAHHYEKAQHPLRHTWRVLRSRSPGAYPPGWDKFEVFLAEVGERPSPKHQLRRPNPELPWGVSNAGWKAPAVSGRDPMLPETRSEYSRKWNLEKRFNLTGADFDRMVVEQGNVCAVCREPETHKYPSGKIKALSVDHDHVTGAVRGLLCYNCNQSIGRMQDNPARLRAAADYLERNAHALA